MQLLVTSLILLNLLFTYGEKTEREQPILAQWKTKYNYHMRYQ